MISMPGFIFFALAGLVLVAVAYVCVYPPGRQKTRPQQYIGDDDSLFRPGTIQRVATVSCPRCGTRAVLDGTITQDMEYFNLWRDTTVSCLQKDGWSSFHTGIWLCPDCTADVTALVDSETRT